MKRFPIRPGDPDYTGEMPTYLGRPLDAQERYVPGHVLVRFRSQLPEEWMAIAHGVVRAKVVKEYRMVEGLQLVQLAGDVSVEEAIRAYQKMPEVLYAQPDYILYATLTPNDPCFTGNVSGTCTQTRDMWGLHNTGQNGGTNDVDIDAPEAWNTTTGNAGSGPTDNNAVHIVLIDSGVDFNHEDLSANMAQLESDCSDGLDNDGNGHIDDCRGFDFFNNDNNPIDDNNHGTHVSGTIGAKGNNSTGVVGVNWNVRLVACKFLGSTGSGPISAAVDCLNYVADLKQNRGKNIVATNNSWGSASDPSQALQDAVETNRNAGILFIAAAGNANSNNDTSPNSPSNIFQPNVIAVASTTRTDARSSFSNFGRRNVHLGAPGSAITSTTCYNTEPGSGACTNNSYLSFNGTSMATPHVAGVAALLKAADPTRDWKKIKNLILAGADPTSGMNGVTLTGRRLNANGALNCPSQAANPVVLERVRPIGNSIPGSVGTPITLAALHINCANPNGNVVVTVNPGGQNITLMDEGTNGDIAAGDGIYMGTFTPSVAEQTTLTFPNNDVVTITFGSGGGYTFAPTTFNYRNLSQFAINVNIGDDTSVEVSGLPFPIQFNGGSFTTGYFQSNGDANFTGHFNSPNNVSLPAGSRMTAISPWWDDLFPVQGTNKNVFLDILGSAPNREAVIEWRDVEHFSTCSTGTGVTFQVVFFENSPDILFNYKDTFWASGCGSLNNGGGATVGVQVDPATATQFSFNQQSLSNNMALLWTLQQTNPVPSLSSLVPSSVVAGTVRDLLPVTVNGTNFTSASKVRWNGSNRTSMFVSAGALVAMIPASDLVAAGTAQVTVFTASPGGGTSNAQTFTINNPPPSVAAISPSGATAGGAGFTLVVTGSNLLPGSVVRWNSSNRPTTFVGNSQLRAEIPASDLAMAGSASVTVFNPLPGGGESLPQTFVISSASLAAPGIGWQGPPRPAPKRAATPNRTRPRGRL